MKIRRGWAWAVAGTVVLLLVAIGAAGCAGAATGNGQTTLGAGSSVTETTATPGTGPGATEPSSTAPSSTAPSASTTEASLATTEAAVPAETNPPGDIPDNQAFVAYKAPGGFSVKIPEGWARVGTSSSTSFTDKLNTIVMSWSTASSAPTLESVQSTDVPALRQSEKAFELVKVSTVKLPAGEAVLVTYRANSEPNAVTGKQYRLDVLRYSLFHQGLRVDITLLSPVGADNVDPWNTVVRSVAW
jgi:hypothetical protein